jgi:hypothetical protein
VKDPSSLSYLYNKNASNNILPKFSQIPKEREAHASVSNSFFKVHETFYISVFFMALGVKQKWTDVRVIVLGVGDNMPFPVL